MAGSFAGMWGKQDIGRGPRLRDKLRMLVRGGRVREKLVKARRRFEKDARYLEIELSKFRAMEKDLMARLRRTVEEGDKVMANVLSNEVANLRKVIGTVDKIRAAFRQIALRLGLIVDFGDAVSEFEQLAKLIRMAAPLVAKVAPQFLDDVREVNDVLDEIMRETEMDADDIVPVQPVSEDAQKVLEAVELAVKHDEELGLPEGPSGGMAARARRVGGGF